MNENIKKTCDLIIQNRTTLKKCMRWEIDSNTYAVMGGILTASKGIEADSVQYKECKKIIRANISAFSEIRGIVEAVVAVKMIPVEDREEYIKGVQAVYKKLRAIHKLTASPYMVMAAINIYESKGLERADEEIDRLENLYRGLRAKHPLMVTDGDRGYLSMLIGLDINVDKAIDDIERNYEACKKISISKDTVYSLAQVLALSRKSPEENRDYVKNVIDGVKANKKHVGKRYALTVIGALSLLGISEEQLVQDIVDADNYIKGKAGFKWYDQSTSLRVVYAMLAVFLTYSGESELSSTLSSNIAMVITEEIILLILLMISSANSASHSSSSN